MQAYFGWAKAACLCSYCCNRHLCYDGGRLGRVKIVTLGAPPSPSPFFPASFDSPHFLPSFRVSTCAFASKTFAHPKKLPSPKCPAPPPKKILSSQYISNYIRKIVQTQRGWRTHSNISQHCVSKYTRFYLSAYSFQKVSGGTCLSTPYVAFGHSGLLP